jgi:hypothetical protein
MDGPPRSDELNIDALLSQWSAARARIERAFPRANPIGAVRGAERKAPQPFFTGPNDDGKWVVENAAARATTAMVLMCREASAVVS